MLTWCTMPVPGGTTLKSSNARLAPAQELVALVVALVLELDVALERVRRAEQVGDHRVVDDQLGRRQRVDLGRRRRRGRPSPRAWWPGRRRTGTPVKSCMTTRAGVNWISVSGSASGPSAASARMWSAVMFAPSSVRSRFSSSIFRLSRAAARALHRVEPVDLVRRAAPPRASPCCRSCPASRSPQRTPLVVTADHPARPAVHRATPCTARYLDIKILCIHRAAGDPGTVRGCADDYRPADEVRASLGRQTFMTPARRQATVVEPGRVRDRAAVPRGPVPAERASCTPA